MSYKRSPDGKRVTLAHKAARLTKYAVRPLDADAILATRHYHHGWTVAR